MPGVLIGKSVTSEMLEAFVKRLDVVVAGWDLKPCYWLKQRWVPKSWWWLEREWNAKRSLIRRWFLVVLKAVEAVEAEWVSRLSLRQLVYFLFFLVSNPLCLETLMQS